MTSVNPIQRELPMHVAIYRPVVTLAGAMAMLDETEYGVRCRIEDGRLPWVWDISASGSAQAELRILTMGVKCLQQDVPLAADDAEALALVYGREKPFISGSHFRRSWTCSEDHVHRLIECGAVRVVEGTGWRRGRGGSPCITWRSAADFLHTRRYVA